MTESPYTARVPVLDAVVSRLPRPVRDPLYRHKELVKFAVVGGTTFVIDTGLFLGLKHSVLEAKPTVSKVIATLVATIAIATPLPGAIPAAASARVHEPGWYPPRVGEAASSRTEVNQVPSTACGLARRTARARSRTQTG